MIESLTCEQEAKIPEFHDKWIAKASEPVNLERGISAIHEIFKQMSMQPPVVVVGQSLKETVMLASLFFSNQEKYENLTQDAIQDVLMSDYKNLKNTSKLTAHFSAIKENSYISTWWLSWAGWYDYAQYIGVKFDQKIYDTFMNFVEEISFIIPYDESDGGIVFISEKPKCYWQNRLLHRDGGKAIEYPNGDGYYTLHGVPVDEYLAMTPSEELDIQYFNKQKQADIRTEFVRKYGIDRMLEFGKKVDSYENYDNEWFTKSQYELYDMAKLFPSISYAPHLKMTNQTTGIFHVEAVSPSCRTVADAVKDRFGNRELQIMGIA